MKNTANTRAALAAELARLYKSAEAIGREYVAASYAAKVFSSIATDEEQACANELAFTLKLAEMQTVATIDRLAAMERRQASAPAEEEDPLTALFGNAQSIGGQPAAREAAAFKRARDKATAEGRIIGAVLA